MLLSKMEIECALFSCDRDMLRPLLKIEHLKRFKGMELPTSQIVTVL